MSISGSLRPTTTLRDNEPAEAGNILEPNGSSGPTQLSDLSVPLPIPPDEIAAENVIVCDLTESDPLLTTPGEEDTLELDNDILEILGEDPTVITIYGKPIQKELAVRLQHIATSGLSKEDRKEIMEKYNVPENAKLFDAPILNPEMKAPSCLSEAVLKRDKAIFHKQKQLASAISSLSEAITWIITSKQKNPTLLKLLMDTGRNLCDIQNSESVTRRNYALTSLKKDMKEQLKLSKIDSHLFGENLPDTLKSAKTINTNAAYLKQDTPKPPNWSAPTKKTFYNTTKPLNAKGPFPVRRQPGPPRTNQPQPAPYQKSQPSNSSRQYRPPPPPPQQPFRRSYCR